MVANETFIAEHVLKKLQKLGSAVLEVANWRSPERVQRIASRFGIVSSMKGDVKGHTSSLDWSGM